MQPMSPNDIYDAMAAALVRGDVTEFDRLSDIADAQTAEYEQRVRGPAALIGAALWYAKQGIPVFPLRPGDKIPAIRSPHKPGSAERSTCRGECGQYGHGLHDASTDPDVLRRWWGLNPQYNIGLATGHKFDVFDVDGPSGYQAVAQMRDNGLLPIVLGVVRTPGKGGRHFYVPPTGRGNRAKIRPDLDYRGLGGYVAAPPSRIALPETDPRAVFRFDMYEWLEPLTLETT